SLLVLGSFRESSVVQPHGALVGTEHQTAGGTGGGVQVVVKAWVAGCTVRFSHEGEPSRGRLAAARGDPHRHILGKLPEIDIAAQSRRFLDLSEVVETTRVARTPVEAQDGV